MRDSERLERFTSREYRPGDEPAILDLFARSFHQQRSIEELDFIVPQNVKYRRFSRRREPNKPPIIDSDSCDLRGETCFRSLISSQIAKIHSGIIQ